MSKHSTHLGTMALAIGLAISAWAGPAAAQTATDLICSGCVGTNDLANDSIGDRKLKDDSVGDRKIKDGAIGQNKIKDDAIGQNKIKNNAIGQNKLKDNAVSTAKIANGAVTSSKILDGAVGQSEIGPNAVNSGGVANNSLFDVDMVDEAGADFADGNNSVTLPVGATVIRTVSITKPTGGVVIVNASGHFSFISTGADGARCSISTGTTVDFSHLIIGNDFGSTAGSNDFMPFASTRGFEITTAGTSTFRLVCEEFEGNVRIDDGSLNAIFVPTRY